MKVDLEKAYDKVNWNFLKNVLDEMNFPEQFSSLIMSCVSSMHLSVLWNGNITEKFKPEGDPLSPYLFVIYLEKLSRLIDAAVASKKWQMLAPCQGGVLISHMFFADVILCCSQKRLQSRLARCYKF